MEIGTTFFIENTTSHSHIGLNRGLTFNPLCMGDKVLFGQNRNTIKTQKKKNSHKRIWITSILFLFYFKLLVQDINRQYLQNCNNISAISIKKIMQKTVLLIMNLWHRTWFSYLDSSTTWELGFLNEERFKRDHFHVYGRERVSCRIGNAPQW